jgi:hypothetical protein
MGGPSKINETNNIPRALPSLVRLLFHADPATGIAKACTVQELVALFSGLTPTISYADQTALLANTDLPIGFLAFVANSSDGWALYLYNGPAPDNIANYTLLLSHGNAVVVDPAAGIVLNFDGRKNRKFVTTTNIAAPKIITVTNDANKGHLDYTFPISNVAGVLTMPATFKMNDVRKVGNDWTPDNVGRYKLVGDWDGTNWNLDMYGPYE